MSDANQKTLFGPLAGAKSPLLYRYLASSLLRQESKFGVLSAPSPTLIRPVANQKHIAILRTGIKAWNRWRRDSNEIPDLAGLELGKAVQDGANFSVANLNYVNFSKANLHGINLSEADLGGANLSEAVLSTAKLCFGNFVQADFRNADCRSADFAGALLVGADLSGANLEGANLLHTDLTEANLSRAKLMHAKLSETVLREGCLTGADFASARFYSTIVGDANLREAHNLDLAKHEGPSTIGIDTLYRSEGKIDEAFLRGAGIPDDFIAYIPSLFSNPLAIQFYSCFISYSHKDEAFAQRLHSALRDKHLRVWYAPEDIKAGRKLHDQIDEAIRLHDKLLLVLSDNSILSEWVMTEIRKARRRELKEKRQVLFPIRLTDMTTLKEWSCFDADSGKDLAVEVREYFVPDFSNWKNHDSFQQALERLVKDLKNSEPKH